MDLSKEIVIRTPINLYLYGDPRFHELLVQVRRFHFQRYRLPARHLPIRLRFLLHRQLRLPLE